MNHECATPYCRDPATVMPPNPRMCDRHKHTPLFITPPPLND